LKPLSIDRSELAEVFFEKVLVMTWNSGSAVMIFVGFAMWFGATVAVLMAMDVLECFLHALRLHWVEFQNKFFGATGVAFVPFSYEVAEDK
jgi:V-type H+-transporting ATPase subunit a